MIYLEGLPIRFALELATNNFEHVSKLSILLANKTQNLSW